MACLYTLDKLLKHLLRENASELHVLAESTPFIIVNNEPITVGSGCITNDNVVDLLHGLATVDQMQELRACGDVHFIYLFRNWARLAVVASIAHDNAFNIKIKNLGR